MFIYNGLLLFNGSGSPPVNSVAPAISGTAMVNSVLTCTTGTWIGSTPITITYQWLRNGVAISGATASTYTILIADLGKSITCRATGTNSAGTAYADSNAINVGSSLGALLSSAVFDLDATLAASYSGSGVTWSNLVPTPADGAAQSAYDFYRGDGVTSTTYPTFNGSAGAQSAFWSADGGDNFRLKSASNTTFLNSLHKTTGNSDFWIALAFRPVDNASVSGLFTTQSGTSGIGLRVELLSDENAYLRQRGGTNNSDSSQSQLTAGTDYLLIMSRSNSNNNTRIWLNTDTAVDSSHAFNATSSDASAYARILSRVTDSGAVANGTRLYACACGNEYLDNTKATLLRDAIKARHGRTY